MRQISPTINVKLNERLSYNKDFTDNFIQEWEYNYKMQMAEIQIFNPQFVSSWSNKQKRYFIKLLYHQRAHFHDILWIMGNSAPNNLERKLILENIYDEFGKYGRSHEDLYMDFAKSFGIDLSDEIIDEKYYLNFLREYNKGHMKWLKSKDWEHKIAGFAAIERFDNIDYTSLYQTAIAMGAKHEGLNFFLAHMYVDHFDNLKNGTFMSLCYNKPEIIRSTFNELGKYQLDIWKKISAELIKQGKMC